MRFVWRRPCSKVQYETGGQARAALRAVRLRLKGRRHHKRRALRRVYKCHRCGQWHLTSMSK